MMDDVIQLRISDNRHDMQEYNLPDSIPKNIASVQKPSKEDVIQAHITRFKHTQLIASQLTINSYIIQYCYIILMYLKPTYTLFMKFKMHNV